jgi:hypothetical protein
LRKGQNANQKQTEDEKCPFSLHDRLTSFIKRSHFEIHAFRAVPGNVKMVEMWGKRIGIFLSAKEIDMVGFIQRIGFTQAFEILNPPSQSQ